MSDIENGSLADTFYTSWLWLPWSYWLVFFSLIVNDMSLFMQYSDICMMSYLQHFFKFNPLKNPVGSSVSILYSWRNWNSDTYGLLLISGMSRTLFVFYFVALMWVILLLFISLNSHNTHLGRYNFFCCIDEEVRFQWDSRNLSMLLN